MKKWFRTAFKTEDQVLLGEQMAEFANRHNLKPGEFFIAAQSSLGGEALYTTVLYYAEKPIEDLFGNQ